MEGARVLAETTLRALATRYEGDEAFPESA